MNRIEYGRQLQFFALQRSLLGMFLSEAFMALPEPFTLRIAEVDGHRCIATREMDLTRINVAVKGTPDGRAIITRIEGLG